MKILIFILLILCTINSYSQEFKYPFKVSKFIVKQCEGKIDTLEIAYIKEPLLNHKNNLIIFSVLDINNKGFKIIRSDVEWFKELKLE